MFCYYKFHFQIFKKYENYNLKIFKVSFFLKLVFSFFFSNFKKILKLLKFRNPLETELKKK